MNKSFLTTAALVLAGTVAANAWTTAQKDKIWEQDTDTTKYTYTNVHNNVEFAPYNNGSILWKSTGTSTEVNIHCTSGYTVDFTQDARYEISFQVRFDGQDTNNSRPYCNLTLVNKGNDVSLLFGNANDNHAQLGIVLGSDITSTQQHESLCYPDTVGRYKYSSSLGGAVSAGQYVYTIIFETFADPTVNDKIYFGVSKVGGQSTQVLVVESDDLMAGGHQNQVFDDIGFSLKGAAYTASSGNVSFDTVNGQAGVAMLASNVKYSSWTRTAETIPEPSAFGLIAGMGALALVASRRRRK